MFRLILLLLISSNLLLSKILIRPDEAMRIHFGKNIEISKKNILLVKEEINLAQKLAQRRIKDRIFRIYIAKRDNNIVGYGVIHTSKVRTKDETAIYLIDSEQKLKAIEIIAFYEPPEYLPSKNWLKQFEGTTTENRLKIKQDIRAISGATLSARAITDSAKVALSILKVAIKNGRI